MAPRPMLPADDLYARLELPVDASYEAVEIAWRALLKQHHPDVAGPTRAASSPSGSTSPMTGCPIRSCGRATTASAIPVGPRSHRLGRRGRSAGARAAPRDAVATAARPSAVRVDPAEAIAQHVDRIRRLTEDELDRLRSPRAPRSRSSRRSRASCPPIARTRFDRSSRWSRPHCRDADAGIRRRAMLPSAMPRRSSSGRSSTSISREPSASASGSG